MLQWALEELEVQRGRAKHFEEQLRLSEKVIEENLKKLRIAALGAKEGLLKEQQLVNQVHAWTSHSAELQRQLDAWEAMAVAQDGKVAQLRGFLDRAHKAIADAHDVCTAVRRSP